MISLRGLLILVSIPIKLTLLAIRYPFVDGINEKVQNSLTNSLKVQFVRLALSLSVKDAAEVGVMKNCFIINRFLKFLYPGLTKLNNYGKRYDKQSIWLVEAKNRSKSDPIIIYCHGGGYIFETQPTQIEAVLSFYHLLDNERKQKTSILVQEYGLAGKGNFIGSQLYEVVATYNKLASEGNDNIVLMGDSAGGNLVIALLQYLKQQKNPKLPWPKSAVLISPWVKIVPDVYQMAPGHSYYENEKRDILNGRFAGNKGRMKAMFGVNDYKSLLVSPGNLPYKADDWSDIPTLNNKGFSTFVLVGEHEVFRDDILEWAKHAIQSTLVPQPDSNGVFDARVHEYKSDGQDKAYIDIVVEPWGIHDAVVLFENNIIRKLRKAPFLKVENLDKVEYFGVVKIVEFLNRTLIVGEETENLVRPVHTVMKSSPVSA
ncbi:hypothetical protein FOB58_003859 [Candida parapsilosis]|uniref:Alpha/beta hydrolase fold-3 domain-containing protein n=2 Tax=Candida parapsilosis TaxID=5480 RepID=G8B9I5_CANPC|nr:uncharacterized protein CPAR2_302740 [Candida parapsilosis]KAF6044221.1 hypothetical protein FOB60_005314 [Candida parapsilosis]KAF6047781.1 hypothetical protein FOB58_003859 [Candida parapsilosis]KAF6050251.1 hypothetical protein FOB59_002497 [Candida parapsilosis]KAF6061371.1 hypothetical protein FOB61_004128 [Candida parapsilosis]KAI5904226.1 putative steryl acetyl hydrolase mug81 [Candida parapsilosis]